jgi:hypothetical protein
VNNEPEDDFFDDVTGAHVTAQAKSQPKPKPKSDASKK